MVSGDFLPKEADEKAKQERVVLTETQQIL